MRATVFFTVSSNRRLWLPAHWLLAFLIIAEVQASQAPFRDKHAARIYSDLLIARFTAATVSEALSDARRNSHLDDAVVQQNLDTIEATLPKKLQALRAPLATRFLERSTFGRSFVRHSYEISDGSDELRCMFTYRRKTDGWRLNQIWCD